MKHPEQRILFGVGKVNRVPSSSWLKLRVSEKVQHHHPLASSRSGGWALVVVQPLSHVWLYVTPWTAAHQAPLSFTVSHSLLKLMSIEPVMLSVSSSAKTPENPNWKLSVLQVLVVIPINSNDSQSLKYEDDIPKSKKDFTSSSCLWHNTYHIVIVRNLWANPCKALSIVLAT